MREVSELNGLTLRKVSNLALQRLLVSNVLTLAVDVDLTSHIFSPDLFLDGFGHFGWQFIAGLKWGRNEVEDLVDLEQEARFQVGRGVAVRKLAAFSQRFVEVKSARSLTFFSRVRQLGLVAVGAAFLTLAKGFFYELLQPQRVSGVRIVTCTLGPVPDAVDDVEVRCNDAI